MTTTAQASLILLAAGATTAALTVRSRRHLPTLSLLVRGLYHVARFWWCIANAADGALFVFRDQWREAGEQIRPSNEIFWEQESEADDDVRGNHD